MIHHTYANLIELAAITDTCPDPIQRLCAIFRFVEHANDDSLRESLQWHTAHFLHSCCTFIEDKRERTARLESEMTTLKMIQTQPHLQPTPHPSGVRSNAALASSAARQETVGRTQIGATAIELFDQTNWKVSGNVFTKSRKSYASLVTFEFGAVVARLSLTIRKGPSHWFTVGLISSKLSKMVLTEYLPTLTGGAGWELHPTCLYAMQNGFDTSYGYACLGGREGQRVVMEADGREGKRTLKLSQDGETQPVYFTNIPIPFRFAVYIY
ncbi:hypothetical protein BLNAU_13856 [Blattamonas nauphoetae]|uniref:Uncharacterized protein n=1 Tax=Blattamonas nauphoetae TaxID=2049346 RepID=A0ABQ9XJ67_9EUKA|nr:hypothetical protein BLNAU_13856 [Blattamonas nauphoetae]